MGYSSRSHALFTLRLEGASRQHCAKSVPVSEDEACRASEIGASLGWSAKLSIVDLAGCENQKMEQSEDGRYINRSLFFLGEVISRLCAGARRSATPERCTRRRAASLRPGGTP